MKPDQVEKMVKEFRMLAAEYADNSLDGLGVSKLAGDLHKLIDQITSNVYGQEFAYCGRTHTVAS